MSTDLEKAVMTFRLEPDKMARLREIAEAEHRTISQELRWLVDRRLAEVGPEKQPA